MSLTQEATCTSTLLFIWIKLKASVLSLSYGLFPPVISQMIKSASQFVSLSKSHFSLVLYWGFFRFYCISPACSLRHVELSNHCSPELQQIINAQAECPQLLLKSGAAESSPYLSKSECKFLPSKKSSPFCGQVITLNSKGWRNEKLAFAQEVTVVLRDKSVIAY